MKRELVYFTSLSKMTLPPSAKVADISSSAFSVAVNFSTTSPVTSGSVGVVGRGGASSRPALPVRCELMDQTSDRLA